MTDVRTAAALGPVTGRLRTDAEAEAQRLRSAARAEADAIRAQARQDAAAAIEGATAAAAAMAAPLTAAELRRARDAARSAVLDAQREACEELHRQIRAGVAALAEQPEYEQLASRIARLASQAAGPRALLSPDPAGGVVARSPGVIVDCSLTRLADLAMAHLGPAISGLWAP